MIDIEFDFRRDTPAGRDPDIFSPTLRVYHRLLWSKNLPNGICFSLNDSKKNVYLHHQSELGEFSLSSDSATHTFSRWKSMRSIIEIVDPHEIEEFRTLGYTIGGMIIFPSTRVCKKPTMNGARGFHPLIKDRIDLTLECIRRHYNNESSPLSNAIARYRSFFSLFESFKGYVEFFLLQDLVKPDFNSIEFLMDFDNFSGPVIPDSLKSYLNYKARTTNFIKNRGQRMIQHLQSPL